MDSERAAQILAALTGARDPGATAGEIDDLLELGVIDVASGDARIGLSRTAAGLDSARAAVRDQRRALDLAWGPRTGPRTAATATALLTAQVALRDAVQDLEACSLAQSTLAALVPNAGTGTYLSITMSGRQMAADLGVWQSRFRSADLTSFVDRVVGIRRLLGNWVGSAAPIADGLESANLAQRFHWLGAAERASALMLLTQGGGDQSPDYLCARVATQYPHVGRQLPTPSDGLMVATVLGASNGDGAPLRAAFASTLASLLAGSPFASGTPFQVTLLAASLAELVVNGDTGVLSRATAMSQTIGSADPLGVGILVRSGMSPADAAVRFRAGMEALRSVGYTDGSLPTSACILAASPVATSEFGARLSALDPSARSSFPAAPIAASLLASLPVAPAEALLLQKYAMAEISAGSFFDETPEIDYLALLLVTGFVTSGDAAAALGLPIPPGPPDLSVVPGPTGGGALRSSAPLPSTSAAVAAVPIGALVLPALFAGQAFWLYQSYLDYTRQHPVHSNSVPIYG